MPAADLLSPTQDWVSGASSSHPRSRGGW